VQEHPIEPLAREERQLLERGAPRLGHRGDDPAPGSGDLGVGLPLQPLVELALAVARPREVSVRVDETGERCPAGPVEDDVGGARGVAVAPDVLGVRPDPGDEPLLGDERRILDPRDPPLLGARPGGVSEGGRELGEVTDDEAAQTASPSFRFGRMT
jgi:hypothetical protein